MYFVLTTAGQHYLETHQGILPVLSSFSLGSGSNYLPSAEQTFLLGGIVYTGVPSLPVAINQNILRYTLFVDYNVPAFSFGEVILYVDGNIPFAVGTSSSLIVKSQLTSSSQGSSLSIDCYIPSSVATGYYPYAELANSSNELMLQSAGAIDLLPQANSAVPNVYSVVSAASDRQSTLAISDNALWSISDYTQYTQAIPVSGFSSFYLDFEFNPSSPLAIPNPGSNYGDVVIQVVEGRAVGTVRVVRTYQEILNTRRYTFDTPLQNLPSMGDNVRIYVKTIQGSKYWNLLNGLDPSITSGHINGLLVNPVTSMIRADGTRPLAGNWSAGNNRISSLGNAVAGQDAANLQTVQLRISDALGSLQHNAVSGLQGGASSEFYHLNQATYEKIFLWANSGVPSDSLPTASTSVLGLVRLATNAQTSDLTTSQATVTPSSLNFAISSPTTNNLQLALSSKLRELNPLVQTGSGAPTISTPINPSLYIDLANPSTPVSYAYSVQNSTWYRVASSGAADQGLLGSSLAISGQSTLAETNISGLVNITNDLSVTGNSNLSGNATLGANGNNTLIVKAAASFNSGIILNSTSEYPLRIGSNASTTNIGIGQAGASGVLAPLSSITSGSRNTCVGKGAGGKLATGSHNTVMGTDAAADSTECNNNVLIGVQSGKFITTASNNVAVGFSSLLNTGSNGSVAIGYEASLSNTSGINVCVGASSGRLLTTGTWNTAIGSNALSSSTTGNFNLALGHNSLASFNNSNTTGPCTAVGYGSLRQLTTGGSNTALGYNSLNAATTTVRTIALGNEALSTYTGTGDFIFIGGMYSGQNIPSTARRSVVIGTEASSSIDATEFNVSIGYQTSVSGTRNIAIGTYARGEVTSFTSGNVVIGDFASFAENGSTVSNVVAIGSSANAYAATSISIGRSAQVRASATSSISIGYLANIYGANNIALGQSSGVDTSNTTPSTGCTAIGSSARAVGTNSIAIGTSAQVTASNAILIGPNTTAGVANSVTLGSSSHTSYNIYTAQWTNISDARDKKDIEDLDLGLSVINKLNPVKFRWNLRDGGRLDDLDSGFIAQEVLAAVGSDNNKFLRVVNTDDENQLRLSSTCLIPIMVNAINELTAEIEMLRRELRGV